MLDIQKERLLIHCLFNDERVQNNYQSPCNKREDIVEDYISI